MANCPEINNVTVHSTENIKYDGPPLVCSDINTCDDLNVAFQKIDTVVCDTNDNVATLTENVNSVGISVASILDDLTIITNQLGLCCPTTTTTTTITPTTTTTSTTMKIPCLNYIIQATAPNATWNALTCVDGEYIEGTLSNAGDITSSACVQAETVNGVNINLLIGVSCTTTTTTTIACDCYTYDVNILQEDLDNSDVGEVVVTIPIQCDGVINKKLTYKTAGVYEICVRSDSGVPTQYINIDTISTPTVSQPINTNLCCEITTTTTTTII
jgi:hypothetical protein